MNANTSTTPCTSGMSRCEIAVTANWPRPGQPKMLSVSTAPPSSSPNRRPMILTTGSSALRKPWPRATRHAERPLAMAVRTKSWLRVSSIEARTTRLITAALYKPSVMAGSAR